MHHFYGFFSAAWFQLPQVSSNLGNTNPVKRESSTREKLHEIFNRWNFIYKRIYSWLSISGVLVISNTCLSVFSSYLCWTFMYVKHFSIALLGVRDTDSDAQKHFLSFGKKRRLAETFLVKVLFEVWLIWMNVLVNSCIEIYCCVV